ncbi:hypothetical protein TgHK011_003048 [Trichoderma gracile]|nr:hypothetical protein TgHK011_003048 [Trichoderma gracile]
MGAASGRVVLVSALDWTEDWQSAWLLEQTRPGAGRAASSVGGEAGAWSPCQHPSTCAGLPPKSNRHPGGSRAVHTMSLWVTYVGPTRYLTYYYEYSCSLSNCQLQCGPGQKKALQGLATTLARSPASPRDKQDSQPGRPDSEITPAAPLLHAVPVTWTVPRGLLLLLSPAIRKRS